MGIIRVLLAEDHAVVREATAEVINHQPDMEVVGQASNGEEAIVLAREHEPDVVVMDIAMPRLNGLEATRQIVADCTRCKVLVLTAREEEKYVIHLLQAGATGYLPKDVSLDEMLNTIRTVAKGQSVLPPEIAAIVMRHLQGEEIAEEEASPLTERELLVLQLVAKGLTNYDIAQRLYVSVRTVEAQLTRVYIKLDVGSRTEAVVHAIQRGWLLGETT